MKGFQTSFDLKDAAVEKVIILEKAKEMMANNYVWRLFLRRNAEDLLLSPTILWTFLIAPDTHSLNLISQFTQNQTRKRIEHDVNTLIVKKAKQ